MKTVTLYYDKDSEAENVAALIGLTMIGDPTNELKDHRFVPPQAIALGEHTTRAKGGFPNG